MSVGEPELFSPLVSVSIAISVGAVDGAGPPSSDMGRIGGLGGGGGGEICVDLVFPGALVGSKGANPVFLSAVGRSEAGRKPSPLTVSFTDSVAELKATKPVSGGVSGGFGGRGGVNSFKVLSAQVLIWVLEILVRDAHRAIALW